MKIIAIISIVLTYSTAFGFDSFDSMRCDNGIASIGDTTAVITEKCGSPTAIRGSRRIVRSAGKDYFGQEWIYDFGPTQFIQVAIISGNKAIKFYSEREPGRSSVKVFK
jgi:hypothetical protein